MNGSIAAATSSALAVFNAAYFGGTSTTTITSDGFLGVGTSSSWAKLSIGQFNGGSSPLFAIASSTDFGATSTAFIVDQFGNVGVGTTTPAARFNIEQRFTGTSGSLTGFIQTLIPAATSNSSASISSMRTSIETAADANDYNILVASAPRVFFNSSGTLTDGRGDNLVFRNRGVGTVTSGVGGRFEVDNDSTGTFTAAKAGYFTLNNLANGGTMTTAFGSQIAATNVTGGTIGALYGSYFSLSNSGSATNTYGYTAVRQF